MTRWTKKFFVTMVSLSTVYGSVADVHACGGGRSRGGYSSYRPAYAHRPVYAAPQPAYHPQPQYGQYGAVPQQYAPAPQQQYAPAPQQQYAQAPQQQYAPTPQQQYSGSAVQQLGGTQPQQFWGASPAQGGQTAQPQVQQPTQLSGNSGFNGQLPPAVQRNVAPRVNNPAIAQPAPTTAPSAAPSGPDSSAQMSALQALADMVDGEAQAEAEPATAAPAAPDQANASAQGGNWIAKLPNGASVQLVLDTNGSFNWIAVNSGKTSTFQGSYSFDNGSLTLIRSSDNQKLAGTITRTGTDGFNFKLVGSKDSGLNFARG